MISLLKKKIIIITISSNHDCYVLHRSKKYPFSIIELQNTNSRNIRVDTTVG